MMMNAMTDKELEMVVGGDYGDGDRDNGLTPRYQVGQEVEVYNTLFHWTTHRKKICDVERESDGTWTYHIKNYQGFPDAYIGADTIQSK